MTFREFKKLGNNSVLYCPITSSNRKDSLIDTGKVYTIFSNTLFLWYRSDSAYGTSKYPLEYYAQIS